MVRLSVTLIVLGTIPKEKVDDPEYKATAFAVFNKGILLSPPCNKVLLGVVGKLKSSAPYATPLRVVLDEVVLEPSEMLYRILATDKFVGFKLPEAVTFIGTEALKRLI